MYIHVRPNMDIHEMKAAMMEGKEKADMPGVDRAA
jgi:hypothetical protein